MAETSARLNECDEIQVMADDDVSTANSDYNWEAAYKNIALAAKIHLSLFVEPDGCVQGEISDAENRCKFPLRHEGDRKLKLFGRSRSDDVEWCDVAQVRIYKASSLESQPVIVDAEVFEFDRHSSAEILVKDASVMHIKIEMRYIRQRWVELPKFTVGDLMLDFHDGEPPLQVYGALLSLYSPHMAKYLEGVTDSDLPVVVDMASDERKAMCEVLYQIYDTGRPIWADFRALSKGAVNYGFQQLIRRLSGHIVKYELISFAQKVKEAAKLKLFPAIAQLAYESEKKGLWLSLVHSGLNPKEEFGPEVYYDHICPAILRAKQSGEAVPFDEHSSILCDFAQPARWTVPFVVQGRTLYINKGILALHNDSQFGRGNNGEYFARVTVELARALEAADVELFAVVEAMFRYLYPSRCRIQNKYIRPLLVFAHEHQMPILKEALENMLIEEPPVTAEKLLEHLKLAEKYALKNLMVSTITRAEGSYHDVAVKMRLLPEFNTALSVDTRRTLMDRLCSGWALGSSRLAKITPTKNVHRVIEATHAGPHCPDDHELNTFVAVDSQTAFGPVEDILLH
ncbi:BTB/POZ domain containing protein [Aphelenchoides avenae]|nr:BTB/POZ domain containing protein [Aphelenchus avenae]